MIMEWFRSVNYVVILKYFVSWSYLLHILIYSINKDLHTVFMYSNFKPVKQCTAPKANLIERIYNTFVVETVLVQYYNPAANLLCPLFVTFSSAEDRHGEINFCERRPTW